MKNIIIITGASSGIGKEFALQVDTQFHSIDEIWLIARRVDKLSKLASSMKHRARILSKDLTDTCSLTELEKCFKEQNVCIRMLINCAGYGLMGNIEQLSIQEMNGMIRLNCEALTTMTRLCLPYMVKNSRIIQLASSAAFIPQPGFSVYAATKAYVLSFSRALGEEVRHKGIYVTCVCPGPVNTPFFAIAEKYTKTLSIKKYTMVSPQKVVAQALKDSYYKNSMSVYSIPIRLFEIVDKILPHQLILTIMRILK